MKPRPFAPRSLAAVWLLAFGSCMFAASAAAQTAQPDTVPAQPPASTTAQPPALLQPSLSEAAVLPVEPRLIRGNDRVIAPPAVAPELAGASANLRFENTPVADVVHVVMREMARVDYVLHPPIGGSVTLATQGPVSTDQALYLLESALQANGLLMLRDTRGTYHIGRPEALRNIVPGVRQAGNGPLAPGMGAVVVQLSYIGAAEMAAILRPLAPPEAIVRIDTVRNLLVLVGSRTQAEGWIDLVRTFDVDLLKGMSVGVFPLRYASARDIDAAFRLITASAAQGAAAGSAPRAAGGPAGQGGAQPAPGAGAVPTLPAGAASEAALPSQLPLYGAVRILPIERLNSVLVVTPRAAYLDQARAWIEKLDQPGLHSSESQLFVYPVQNGSAAHLASVLNGLFGSGSPAPAADSGVAPGLRPASASSPTIAAVQGGTGGAASVSSLDAAAGAQAGGPPGGVTTLALASGLRIIADHINNAVLIYGSRAEYQKIEATLRRLDVPPTQVMIEASIIEVTLTDDLQYGLQWLFTDRRGSSTGTGVLTSLTNITGGFSYTLRNAAGEVRAVLNALAEKSLVRVISSPSLMVLDNHTASISVGNQQPIRTSQTVTDGGNVTTSIQYKDTGVSLSVTPQVNAGNMVTMQLKQAVTDVGAIDAATGQRTFLQRQIGSKVAVRSGETLVLGGLIRDNDTSGNSGVPALKDIPLFGALFGTQTRSANRTELLVMITPRVVRTDDDLRDVGADLRERMKGLHDWPRQPAGSLPTTQQEP